MQGLVGCEELKGILEDDVAQGKMHVEQLNSLLKNRDVVM